MKSLRGKVTIRTATEHDLAEIQRLHLALCENERKYVPDENMNFTFSEEGKRYFLNRISSPNAIVHVVDYQKKLAGFVIGSMDEKKKSWAKFESVYIDPVLRGRGLGKKLIDEFINWAHKKNADPITVAVADGNPAYEVYIRSGFKVTERKGKTIVLALPRKKLED